MKAQITGLPLNKPSDAGMGAGVRLSVPQDHKGAEVCANPWSLRLCGDRNLEVQLQPKLELPRVEGGGWAAVVAAVVGALVEGADVVDEWRRRGFVETIEEVEAFSNQLQPEALAKRNHLRQAQVEGHVAMRQSEIATKASARKLPSVIKPTQPAVPGTHKRSVGKHRRPVRLVRLVVIRVLVAENVERTTGRDFEDWRDSEVRQEPVEPTSPDSNYSAMQSPR